LALVTHRVTSDNRLSARNLSPIGEDGSNQQPPQGDWIEVAYAEEGLEALMIRGRLAAEGIEAVIHGGPSAPQRAFESPWQGSSGNGCRVLVREDNADTARAILGHVG
jgi:hypothetical protein